MDNTKHILDEKLLVTVKHSYGFDDRIVSFLQRGKECAERTLCTYSAL